MMLDLTWVTDRTQADIDKVLYDLDYSDQALDRATMSVNVMNRYKNNYWDIKDSLNALGMDLQDAKGMSTPNNNYNITCTDPTKPITYRGSDITRSSERYNPLYGILFNLNLLIKILGVDTTGMDIPETTEYLTFQQINDLELAASQATDWLNKMHSGIGVTYAGLGISGGSLL